MGSLKVLLLILFAWLCTTVIGIQSLCQGTHFCMCLVCLSVLGLSLYQRLNRYPSFQCLEVMKKILYGADSVLFQLSKNSTRYIPIFTVRKLSLRRLCFHRCLSVYRRGCLPHCMLGYTPCLGRHPPGRHPTGKHPQADTPWADTPLGQAPPPWADTPPCWDTVNKRVVRILLECNLAVKYRSEYPLSKIPYS